VPPATLVLLARRLDWVGERSEAMTVLRKGRQDHPTDFWVHFMLNEFLLNGRDPGFAAPRELAESIGCARVTVALRPELAVVHNNLGGCLITLREFAEAEAELRRAIEILPGFAMAHLNRADALKGLKRTDEALAEYHRSIELAPRWASPHIALARALAEQNDLDRALTEARTAVTLEPKDVFAHLALGDILDQRREWAGAIEAYHRAIEVNRTNKMKYNLSAAHTHLGNAYKSAGRLPEAIDAHRTAITVNPNAALAHYNLGTALVAADRLDEALGALRRACSLDPGIANAHNNLCHVLTLRNRLDEAIEEGRRAIELDPTRPMFHSNLGRAFALTRRWEEALREYNVALGLDHKYVNARLMLAHTLLNMNQSDRALQEFKAALSLEPENADAYLGLGRALLKEGQFAPARALTQRALGGFSEKHPRRNQAITQLAECNQLIELEARLPDVLAGKVLKDERERLGLIEVCELQHRHVAATRLYAGAFAAGVRPLTESNITRTNAAHHAVLAAAGQGVDADQLDDTERARFRKLALEWLRTALDVWAQRLATDGPRARQPLRDMLTLWLTSRDLASVREPEAIKALPATEQDEFRKLWRDVAALLKKAGDGK
jgi:tetratricopeptide (TPR) repeat protein